VGFAALRVEDERTGRSGSGVVSLSSAFTQTRLFWPDGVNILFLMLSYLSTLRSKTGFCLVRPKNAYFANSLNTSHRPRIALASLRKATPRPASDRGQRKAKRRGVAVITSNCRGLLFKEYGRLGKRWKNTKKVCSLFRGQEPVERIYANPTFLA
jgi:hypothetical protein